MYSQILRKVAKYKSLGLWVGLSLLAYGGLVQLHWQTGSLTFANIPLTLRWYALAFAAFIASAVWVERRGGISLKIIFGAALLYRLMLLFTVPTLSGDVHRYVWDGYIATQGVSPYAYAVNAPELDHLDIPERGLVDHNWMASPYLPVAQNLFALLMAIFPRQPWPFQIAMVIFDMLSGILLVQLLRLATLPIHRSLLYLWNPLVILEVAQGAHVDSWMIFLLLLALWLTLTERLPTWSPWLAPIVLGLATLTKGLPLLLLVVLGWRWRFWQIGLYGLTLALWLIPAGLRAGWGVSGPLDGLGLFGALRIYMDRWNYNSSLFHWLEVDLLPAGVAEANRLAKRIIGATMLAALAGIWLGACQRIDNRTVLRRLAWPLMAYLLLTPTVHPWYLLILLVFLPFLAPGPDERVFGWLAVWPWLYLSWAVSLSYRTYLNPLDLREFEWVRRTEWLPTLALLLVWLIGAMVVWLKARVQHPSSTAAPKARLS